MPLTVIFGTNVQKDKAERIAEALKTATGFGAIVKTRGYGLLNPQVYDIELQVLNPTTGEKEYPTVKAVDTKTHEIPDSVLKLVAADKKQDLKDALKAQGAINTANINAAGGGRKGKKQTKKAKKSKSRKASKKSKKSRKAKKGSRKH